MQDSLYSTLPTSGLLKRHVEVMLTPGPESDPLAKASISVLVEIRSVEPYQPPS